MPSTTSSPGSDDTLQVAILADTSGFERSMSDLTLRANAFGTAISAALKGAVSGGKSFDGVLRQLSMRVSAIALDAALKPLTQLAATTIGGAVSGIGSSLFGGAGAEATRVQPFAKGGVVSSPSYFPTGRTVGLMGEAGAEAILPLRRGADGALGVAAPGGSGGGARSNGPAVVINVTTPDAASFQKSQAQIQAMLARAADRGRRGL